MKTRKSIYDIPVVPCPQCTHLRVLHAKYGTGYCPCTGMVIHIRDTRCVYYKPKIPSL